jgi:VWFA-related protein
MQGCHSPLFRLAVSSVFALPLLAQTVWSQEAETPATTLKINVRTVLIDVVVTDKNNKAIPGLGKDDFQVLEDGKPQQITFFEPNFAASPDEASLAPNRNSPPNTFSNVPPVAANNSINLLLMDGLNTPLADQANVHKEMVKYLGSIPPGIRIGVFLLSEKLRIIQGFTQDSALLRASIARLAANPTSSALLPTAAATAAMDTPVNMILQKALEADSQELADIAASLQQFEDQQTYFQVNERTVMTLDALQQMARYLAGVPGRKNLIWFVGSIPQCLAAMSSEAELTAGGCPYEEKYAKTMNMLADARVSLYPIDATGTKVDSLYDTDSPPATASIGDSGNSATAPNVASVPTESQFQALTASQTASIQNDYQNRALAHMQMDRLALATGGKAIYERNSLRAALAQDIDNGSRYYTIAYTPANRKEVGKERKIEIKSASGNYKLAYRRSYFEDTPKELKAAEKVVGGDPLRPLMDRGMPNFTELRYSMKVAPATPQPGPNAPHAGDNGEMFGPYTRFTVNFSLATDGLTLVPGADGVRRGTIEVALVAYSQQGKPLDWEVRSIGLAVRPEQYEAAKSAGIPFHFDIDAPPGDVYLRTGIYDSSSSRAGTLEIPLSTVVVAQR